MEKNKKIVIIVLSIAVFTVVALTIFSKTNNDSVVDNSYYTNNPYTGTSDFVDPDQEPETYGPSLPSFRNAEKIAEISSTEFLADMGKRISEYVFVVEPNEKQLYVLIDTIVNDGNKYVFTVEGGETKKQFKVEAYETRQGYANVFVDGNGPMNFIEPYYVPAEE